MNSNITVALLVGGTSPEREVSKSSSKSILAALKELGYKYKLIDPAYGVNQPGNEEDFFLENDIAGLNNANYSLAINSSLFDDADVAFIGLHGKWGEDGTIQSLLELKGMKYTGSGVLSSALAMDKSMSKIMFQHFDVNTPKWFVVSGNDLDIHLIKAKIKTFFGYPCIFKPNDQGSTIGLTVCRGDSEVELAIASALKYSDKVIVEEFISGYEITVGILEDAVLPVLQIKPKHNLYDYECKYTHGLSEYEVPANFPREVICHLQHQALLAYQSLGCRGYGRADFRLSDKLIPYCLEINTLPGMTSTSLVPKMAKAAGISFPQVVDKIIKYALK